MARELGTSKAAPIPWMARVALRKPGLGARPQANEAAAKPDKSSNEYTFRAQAINYDSSRKKQCRKTERICINYPLQIGHVRSKIGTDPGEGDVDNCYVELNYCEGKATGRYNPRHRAGW